MRIWVISESRKNLVGYIELSLNISLVQIILACKSCRFLEFNLLFSLWYLLNHLWFLFLRNFCCTRPLICRCSTYFWNTWFDFAILEENWVLLEFVLLRNFSFGRLFFGWNHIKFLIFQLFKLLFVLISFHLIWHFLEIV